MMLSHDIQQTRSRAQANILDPRAKHTGSENVCSENLIRFDSEFAGDSRETFDRLTAFAHPDPTTVQPSPLIVICSWCPDYAERTRAALAQGHRVTHTICPECLERVFPEVHEQE